MGLLNVAVDDRCRDRVIVERATIVPIADFNPSLCLSVRCNRAETEALWLLESESIGVEERNSI